MNKTNSQSIHQAFAEGVLLRQQCAELSSEPLYRAATLMLDCLKQGGKVLVCGNGGSAAGKQNMPVVALTGKDGGHLGRHACVAVLLNIPHDSTLRIQEMHITCLHILCSLIDYHFKNRGT